MSKRFHNTLFIWASILTLMFVAISCAPTIEPGTPSQGGYTLRGNVLLIEASAGIQEGAADVRGYNLEVESEYCALQACVPDELGYVDFIFEAGGAQEFMLGRVANPSDVISGTAAFNLNTQPLFFELVKRD